MTKATDLGSMMIALVLRAVEPFEIAAGDPQAADALLALTGWNLDAVAGLGPGELQAAAKGVADAVSAVRSAVEDLGDDDVDIQTLSTVLDGLAQAGAGIAAFGRSWNPVAGLPADLPALFLDDLVGHLAVLTSARYHPTVRSVLDLLGVFSYVDASAILLGNGTVIRPAGRRPRVDLGVVGDLLSDPKDYLLQRLGLTGAGRLPAAQAADQIFPALAAILRDTGLRAWHGDPGYGPTLTPDQREVLAHMLRVAWSHPVASNAGGIATLDVGFALRDADGARELLVVPTGSLAYSTDAGMWTASASLTGTVSSVVIRADGVRFTGPGTRLRLDGAVRRPAGDSPMIRFGASDGPRVEVDAAGVSAFLALDAAAGSQQLDGGVTVELQGLRLVVGASPDDGFLGALLPADGLKASLDLTISWSAESGIQLSGSAALDFVLDLDLEVGPVRLDAVQLGLRLNDAELALLATVSATLRLGTVTAVAERLGLHIVLGPGRTPSGGAELAAGFQPPSGLGLAIAAGPVTGGGYLFVDPDSGTYAGVAQLQFKALSLTAVGLVTTNRSGGGWSFLLLVAVEFPGIPLGFGISLYALGGLVGVHRSVNVSMVRDALRAGRLDTVLFPHDPVANAARVIADIAGMFPSKADRLTVGVMARLGWGPGPLITIEAGLILEIPSPVRLVVLARLRALLPKPEAALVKLRLDVAGVLDFGAAEVSIDGALIDSRVGPFSLAGEMALRASWGATPTFALAAGGFFPGYPRPGGFPSLRRMTISVADSENPRLRLETYLALTAATVQIGARLEAYMEVEILGHIVSASGLLGFDALVRFAPRFGFEVDIYGSVTIAVDDEPWLSAAVFLHLAGTAPWLARGEARVKIGFLPEFAVRLEVTAGEPDRSAPISTSVTARIVDELGRAESLKVLPDASVAAGVALRRPAEAERAVHPGGRVAVLQRVVPLGPRVSRFGTAEVTDPGRYGLRVALGGTVVQGEPLRDMFTPSQFRPEDPQRAISRPEFESLVAGSELTELAPAAGVGATSMSDDYDDRILLPGVAEAFGQAQGPFPESVLQNWNSSDADRLVAMPIHPERFHPRIRPARLGVVSEQWVVTDPATLRPIRLADGVPGPLGPPPLGRAVPPASAVEADELAESRRASGRAVVVAPVYETNVL